jgi:hypothetical protein
MAWGWLNNIKNIANIVSSLYAMIQSGKATKDLLIRELTLNVKAFETAQNSKKMNYDKLLSLLKNDTIQQARRTSFSFKYVKREALKTNTLQMKEIKDILEKHVNGFSKILMRKLKI